MTPENSTPFVQSVFPVVRWGDETATFVAHSAAATPYTTPAVVIFAVSPGGFVVADIPGRGWCTPSGRLEPAETPLEAARRETWEEIGAVVETLQPLGCFLLQPTDDPAAEPLAFPTYLTYVTAYGAIPPDSESRGVRCLTLAELPTHYFRWDALLASVFAMVHETARRP